MICTSTALHCFRRTNYYSLQNALKGVTVRVAFQSEDSSLCGALIVTFNEFGVLALVAFAREGLSLVLGSSALVTATVCRKVGAYILHDLYAYRV